MNKPRCLIVGASAAGVAVAIELRNNGYTGAVTLIDADPNLPYERPPLSKSVLGAGSRGFVPIQPAPIYRDLDIELRLGEKVTAVDPAALTVRLDGGDAVPVSRLVLATGLSPRRLRVAGADAENVLSLRDAADARRIAEELASGGPLVIIGAGFIGLELAAVARERGIDVTVVEAQARPLTHAVGADVASLLMELHRGHGVKLLTGATVAEFAGSAGRVEEVRLADGRRLPASTVVVGVGVEPRTELTVSARIEVDTFGIPVNEFGQTSRAWIYATGDVASQNHPALARRGRIEHWDTAQRHGAAVGATIAGTPTRYREAPYAWSHQYGATLQIVGRPRPDDDLVLRDGASPGEFLAFWIRDGYVGAVAGMAASREVGVVKRLMAARVPVERAQLLGRDLDLRRFLKQHQNAVRANPESTLAS
ncbi:NAD(P)/FAD-dependent oxidoreductase [Amycolatopsis sp. GM8]|uniref:NAD(P)/FAD-dependent oxidoreductase n=1 Tax=Amycolatopsis sp. GM8 TaxID=2896530 RepID=UPI001F19F977|nr:FAD-dependent oxidoreductase [Amycolatopsis sp. GM8]